MKKIVAIDLDGTLLHSDCTISGVHPVKQTIKKI